MGREARVNKAISPHLILQLQESQFVSRAVCLVFFKIKMLENLLSVTFKIKYRRRIADVLKRQN